MERPKWWRVFDPNLTLPLLVIIVFLVLIGVGNVFGIYQALTEGNAGNALLALFSALLYLLPAYGILKLKRWARLLELVFSLILVALGMILVFTGISNRELFQLATQGVIITVLHGSIAAYLLTDRCRRAFGYLVSSPKKETAAAKDNDTAPKPDAKDKGPC